MSNNDGNPTLGFVGLGVMGEPMCRNLAKKSGLPVLAFDLRPEPLRRAAEDGVESAASLADLAARTNIIFLSLPGEPQVRAVVQGPDGLLAQMRAGQTLVDGLPAIGVDRVGHHRHGPRVHQGTGAHAIG